MINNIEEAINIYKNMGLFEHTVVWNHNFCKDHHVKIIDIGYGLAKIFHPKNIIINICNYCVYEDMKENCPHKIKNINNNYK
jgi:hypothetical protein